MNKERKDHLVTLKRVLAASPKLTAKLSRALEKGVEDVLTSEERALRSMEPYKDTPNTAANYRNAEASITHLKAAIEAIVDSDNVLALDHLDGALDPGARQVHKETKPKARRAK